jgi:hypothetical protein
VTAGRLFLPALEPLPGQAAPRRLCTHLLLAIAITPDGGFPGPRLPFPINPLPIILPQVLPPLLPQVGPGIIGLLFGPLMAAVRACFAQFFNGVQAIIAAIAPQWPPAAGAPFADHFWWCMRNSVRNEWWFWVSYGLMGAAFCIIAAILCWESGPGMLGCCVLAGLFLPLLSILAMCALYGSIMAAGGVGPGGPPNIA